MSIGKMCMLLVKYMYCYDFMRKKIPCVSAVFHFHVHLTVFMTNSSPKCWGCFTTGVVLQQPFKYLSNIFSEGERVYSLDLRKHSCVLISLRSTHPSEGRRISFLP